MSEREWKPGDVALVLTESAAPFMAVRTRSGVKTVWRNCLTTTVYADAEVTDVRPLVVIDPDSREQVEWLMHLYCTEQWGHQFDEAQTDRMQAALREFADPTPPKPEEPQGLGAVVEDAVGTKWIRHDSVAINRPWLNTDDCETRYRAYDEIGAVRVLSEGVQP